MSWLAAVFGPRILGIVHAIGRLFRRLEALPGLGILFVPDGKKHRLAARDSLVIVVCGSVGVWYPVLVAAYNGTDQLSFGDRLAAAATRGEVVILVPSLVAPLYLLLATLKNNDRVRRHQIGLFSFSALLSLVTIFFFDRRISNQMENVNSLVGSSVIAFSIAFVLLYLYFLLDDLHGSLLKRIQGSGESLTKSVLALRKREGK